jgi:hypothetical protein
VLLDGHALESLDRGLGCVLRLEIALENVDVVIEPLQILLSDRGNAVQPLAGVEYRLRGRERVGVYGRRLAFDELDTIGAPRKRSRLVPGTCRSISSPPQWTLEIS